MPAIGLADNKGTTMDIQEKSKLCMEYAGQPMLLEALEFIQLELQEDRDSVPWQVRMAYYSLLAGFRQFFAPAEAE